MILSSSRFNKVFNVFKILFGIVGEISTRSLCVYNLVLGVQIK